MLNINFYNLSQTEHFFFKGLLDRFATTDDLDNFESCEPISIVDGIYEYEDALEGNITEKYFIKQLLKFESQGFVVLADDLHTFSLTELYSGCYKAELIRNMKALENE